MSSSLMAQLRPPVAETRTADLRRCAETLAAVSIEDSGPVPFLNRCIFAVETVTSHGSSDVHAYYEKPLVSDKRTIHKMMSRSEVGAEIQKLRDVLSRQHGVLDATRKP